jgi:pyridoxal phosphate enzyme (YggS family)
MAGTGASTAAIEAVLRGNLARVRASVAAACARAGRDPAAVTLVAVTKTCAPPVLRALASLGVLDVGENRVQEADSKRGDLSHLPLRWHMIGHLQTNKVRRALELFHRVHSVDGPALLEALAAEASRRGRTVDGLLQVKMIDEAGKGGFAPDAVEGALRRARELPGIAVRGLMTLPPPSDDPEASRGAFRGLAALRDRLGGASALPDLSMGTSQDYPVAVEEGATLVRVGGALLDGLPGDLYGRAVARPDSPIGGSAAGTGG